ncbi:MAG: hypothetical protein J5J00_14195 [Deltaproteobacteria bacterium]|nr:hypothetical protein [Deltaproteobacteria bacterium]
MLNLHKECRSFGESVQATQPLEIKLPEALLNIPLLTGLPGERLHFERRRSGNAEGIATTFDACEILLSNNFSYQGPNAAILKALLPSITGKSVTDWIARSAGLAHEETLSIAKLQLNRMLPGDVISPHSHSNRSLTLVIGVQEAETGGLHFSTDDFDSEERLLHRLAPGSAILSPGSTIHGVTQVLTGARYTLVYELDVPSPHHNYSPPGWQSARF